MSESTFYKRPGTTNKGGDYEILNIANISMNLVMDEKIQDFRISSNDENFGAFDDIVIEAELENGTEIYACQLKHKEKGILSLKQLTQPKGDYSIEKYFDSVQTLTVPETKFILYTNLRFNVTEDTEFYLDGENFPILATRIYPRFGFNISQKTDHCYKFSVVKNGSCENSSKVLLYETFFDSFFLFDDQDNVHNLARNVVENFQNSFRGNEAECDQYVKCLYKWGLEVGKKEKLIQSCDSQVLESTDLGGRSVLHLACSWGQSYSELNVKYTGNSCIVDDEEMYSTVPESNEYLETIGYLLRKRNLSKIDKIYNMIPVEYAHNTKCLAAEMRIMMEQNIQQSIENSQIINQIINILYYSAYHGYDHEFIYFFKQLNRNSAQKRYRTTKCNVFRKIAIKNKNGMTLLFMAARQGHLKIVEFLVKASAIINLVNNGGSSPLYAASKNGHDKIVEFLVKEGARINLADKDGFTPLYVAALNGHDRIVEFLVKSGAGINHTDNDGKTSLWIASRNGHDKVVEFFVKAGAGVNLAQNDGLTPLHIASYKGHQKIVQFLVEAGAGVNLVDNDGLTPLHVASQKRHERVIEFLVEAGAEINSTKKNCCIML